MNDKQNLQNKGSVFDNPYYNLAYEALSDEDKEKYKKMGQHMYGKIDFEQNTVLNKQPPPAEESLKYIEMSFKSGLLPKDLSPDEVEFMKGTYGTEWYKKYDFVMADLIE